MTEYTFKVNLAGITSLECFKEATKDELKVLIALTSINGEEIGAEDLAKALKISKARVMAAITLFEECGVITKVSNDIFAEVEYEFEPKKGEKAICSGGIVAKAVRDADLHELIVEMENIFEKTLATREIERISSLYEEKCLSEAYILTLASYLKDTRQRLTVESLVREAGRLVEKDVTELEELEIYIKNKSEEIAGEMEMRSLLGIYGRTLTKSERAYFKKWMHEYEYASPIIGEAYDITVAATSKLSLPYMDSILSAWHTSGCRTLEECRAKASITKYEKAQNAKNGSQKSKKNVEAETPKYADFNSEDALMRALERSYKDSE